MELSLLKKKKLACAVNASLSSRSAFQNEELRLIPCLEGTSSLGLLALTYLMVPPSAEWLGVVGTQASRMRKADGPSYS